MEMGRCKACGEGSVIEELENGRTVHVCTDCGVLQSDVQEYVTTNVLEGTSISDGQARGPRGAKTGFTNGPPKGIKFGADNISRIGQSLGMSKDMIAEATSMYNSVYMKIHRTHITTKLAMCGACLYSVARQNREGIGILEVSKYLEIDRNAGKMLRKALKILKNKYDIEAPALPVSAETEHLLAQTDFSPEIRKLTHDIVTMCERYWLSQGRLTRITVSVAVYFAWRAYNFPKPSLDFPAFCKTYDFSCTKSAKQRRGEIEKVFKNAVENIPWLKGKKIHTIDPHIKDAVRYQGSLMQDTLQAAGAYKKPCEQNGTSQDSDKAHCDEHNCDTVFRAKPKQKKRKHPIREEPESKCIKSARHMERTGRGDEDSDSDLNDLGSDDDTDQYIRTAEEVDNLQGMKNEIHYAG